MLPNPGAVLVQREVARLSVAVHGTGLRAGGMQFTFLLLGVALLLVLGIAGAHAVGARRSAAPREPVA